MLKLTEPIARSASCAACFAARSACVACFAARSACVAAEQKQKEIFLRLLSFK
jgi:hypothetical protein